MDATPADGGTWSEVSGTTGDVVQARDVSGGIHFHRLASEVPRPRQLPSPQPVFVDREEAFAGLDGVVSAGAGRIAVVVGMPGVGKTALAVQWSNRNRDRFPDGQLYLNLHGYGEGPPVGPLRALWAFLVALGVPRSELAVDVEEAAAQYRSALAGRRVLIVLDNAREAQQARPLLPGHGACAVLVTSRAHMSGLVAREGARRIVLGVLPENDAVTLLARLVQSDRPDDQPSALGQFARLCARLPLALRIAAEHALSRPRTRLEDLVEDLRGQAALWRALTVEEGDQAEDLAAAQSVFAWSYRALPAEAARVFRLLAMHPGPDFGETAATALAGSRAARRALGILVGAHLLEQLATGRYQFHDLVRSYAMGQARDEEPPELLRDAFRRVLLWYLRSADAAQPWVNPIAARVALAARSDDEQAPESFASREEAARWIEAERGNLVAAVQSAADQSLHEIAWKLAVVLRALHMSLGMLDDWLATSETGLRSAEAIGDLAAQAELLQSMGSAYSLAYDLDRSEVYQGRALEIQRQAGDQPSVARTLNGLGLLQLRRHRPAEARALFEEALGVHDALAAEHLMPVIRVNLALALIDLQRFQEAEILIRSELPVFRARGDALSAGNALRLLSAARRGLGDVDQALAAAQGAVELAVGEGNTLREAYWLLELGTVRRLGGQLAAALDSFRRSADLQHGLGHRVREAQAWDGEGEVQRDLGRLSEAIELHGRAADVFRSLGARWLLAVALRNLATALTAAGRNSQAREQASEALSLLAEFPDPAAEQAKAMLRALI